MTKRQTWIFFLVGTFVCAAVFIALTIQTHTRFDELTHTDQLNPDVKAGMEVWHANNCVNCHTLLGEGAYYAPDLTHITSQRGDAYLTAFLKKPSQFYSPEQNSRVMPNLHLSDQEIKHVIAFLGWVDKIETNGWPPRPILVQGSAIPGANVGGKKPEAASQDPVAQGQQLFHASDIGCFSCHSTTEGVNLVGPSLNGIASRAQQIVKSKDYQGDATDAEGYIRESILHPNAYLVPGDQYSSAGRSIMPANYSDRLDQKQVDQIIQYLMSLK